MEQIVEAVMAWLKEGGFLAVRRMPEGLWPEAREAAVAVSAAKAETDEAGLYSYLGTMQREGTQIPVYGKRIMAEVLLEVIAPRALGAQRCTQEADRLLTALSGGIPALAITKTKMQACRYDAEADSFVCELTLCARGYLYALANEEETEFTDFILKGVVR